MRPGAISITGLGKAYKRYPKRWSRLLEWIAPWSGMHHTAKWVLKDISLLVEPGEAVGIIGVNGAGKSTLLKLIAGTIKATIGKVEIGGRVAALLELGMGFHPDFTGRQNAFMSGQLLGYSSDELRRLMPEIEAFADIGDYLDQPVRVYSSGMQVRLAFSIATAIRPDVIIIDEALSVGDMDFQHKSFNRIRQFRKQGTTLLIVSHDKQMIMSICDRAVLLHQGLIEMSGDPEAVADYYNAVLSDGAKKAISQTLSADGKVKTQSGSGEVELLGVALLDANHAPLEVVQVGQTICIKVNVRCLVAALDSLVVGFSIKDRLGQDVYGTNTFHYNQQLLRLERDNQFEIIFEVPANIGPGTYSISVALHADESHVEKNYLWSDRVILFNVVNHHQPTFVGGAWLPAKVSVHHS